MTPQAEQFWALRDVSFSVEPGERVAIVGKNGAGKSTLLKILSRVTDPSEGRLALQGKVTSLLEVGTGFHPELTGRENIFLNAAILGMSRAQISANFDAIVAFADIERFLDTPVKRFSSGMYLRLAFAVAAHLDPEILIIDEVLAVGDMHFQKKCLGKMEEIGRSGKTILFVSHNFRAVRALCPRSILLSEGRLVCDGKTEDVLDSYLHGGPEQALVWTPPSISCPDEFFVISVAIGTVDGQRTDQFKFDEPIAVEVRYQIVQPRPYRIKLAVSNGDDLQIFFSGEHESSDEVRHKGPGTYCSTCVFPGSILNDGTYWLDIHVDIANEKDLLHKTRILNFTISPSEAMLRFRDRTYGVIYPPTRWHTEIETDRPPPTRP